MVARLVASALLAVILLSSITSAQDAPPKTYLGSGAEATVADETVIVQGQRLNEIEFDLPRYVMEFIEETTTPARGRGFARVVRLQRNEIVSRIVKQEQSLDE